MAFRILYLHDFVTKLCMQQATVILNHENVNICNIGQGEAQHRKYIRLKLGGGQAYDQSIVLECCYILGQYMSNKNNLLYKSGLQAKKDDC